ncbi:hypothetical protein SB87_gp029 [Parapoxvirus red deer/HL953]|uniref:IMV membrane protein n=1 Tax=Parapoxvirus red deer/HL953 TaxID=1579460 RepID=A0A0A7MC28_9POXV|nr:hypothetical protein SB87_gp029 [Parapoxvirus red deer/HL953]AIZ77282.1 hypothetical protein [Parapoxvirus red deer/HL953]
MDRLYAGVFGAFLSNSDEDFEEFLRVVRSVMAEKPRGEHKGPSLSTLVLVGLVLAALGVLLAFYYLKLV